MMSDNQVKLSHFVKNLFLNEDEIHRQEYIDYIYYLISQTDIFNIDLQELNNIDYDIDEIKENYQKVPVINFNHSNCKISDLTVTAYLDSVVQIHQKEYNNQISQLALIFAIINIKIAIVLISIRKKESKTTDKNLIEHRNTIKSLFNRFRIAQKLIKSPEMSNHEDYKWFWNTLKSITSKENITLEFFLEQLKQVQNNEDLEISKKKLLDDIRISYQYFIDLKPKILKGSTAQKLYRLEKYDLDYATDVQCVMEYESHAKPKLELERIHDENKNQSFTFDSQKISALSTESVTVQNYVSNVAVQHIQRLQHIHQCSRLYPDQQSLKALFDECYNDFSTSAPDSQQRKTLAILLLSMLTQVDPEEWLNLQYGRKTPKIGMKRAIQLKNKRQKIIYEKNQFWLSTEFQIFQNDSFEYPHGLLNQTNCFLLPLVKDFIIVFGQEPQIDKSDLYANLSEYRKKLKIPRLSLQRLKSLLHFQLYQQTGNKQIADILLGIDSNHSSSLSYCHHAKPLLHQRYLETLSALSSKLVKILHIAEVDMNFGSRKAPVQQQVIKVFAILRQDVIRACEENKDYLEIFNLYSIWLWHILLLFTAARPVGEFPGFLKHFDLDHNLLWISDKEIAGRQGDGRIIPLCPFIVEQIQYYLVFLKNFQKIYGMRNHELHRHIQKILNNEMTLLTVWSEKEFVALSPKHIYQFVPVLKKLGDNWLRHTTRAYLTNKLDETLILALFGHELSQQEFAHPYSSLSLCDYKTDVMTSLEKMKEYFEIIGIKIYA
jgi:hypothetical protein